MATDHEDPVGDNFIEPLEQPSDTHSRYLIVEETAVGVTTITGLIGLIQSEHFANVLGVVAINSDCKAEQVSIGQLDDGTWVVNPVSDEDCVLEEIRFDNRGGIVHHANFMDAFTTDLVPGFNVSLARRS